MTRPLIDTTPLRLWDGPEADETPRPDPQPPAPVKPTGKCLNCGRSTMPGKTCCSSACKRKWKAGMESWHARLEKTEGPRTEEMP